MPPPFVACRICRSIEGKLKNYTDSKFLIKAYEEFSGCPFVEWTYLTKFCPECACLIRKVYKFRKKCRKSYKFVTEHLQTGRKITKSFIKWTGGEESHLYHKPTNLKTWKGYNIRTIDYVHNPKAYKSKKKPTSEVVFHIKHVTVPKDPEAEKPSVVPKPIYDFNHPYYDSSDLDDVMYPPGIREERRAVRYDKVINNPVSSNDPRPPSPCTLYWEMMLNRNASNAPNASNNTSNVPTSTSTVPNTLNVPEPAVDVLEPEAPIENTSVLCEPDLEDLDVKMEDEMDDESLDGMDDNLDDTAQDDTESNDAIEIDVKKEDNQESDPENLTLQEIKAEILSGKEEVDGVAGKREKKKTGKKKEKASRVSKKSELVQVRARRNKSNQELEEHFTITQFLTEDEQMQEFLKRKQAEGYLEGKYKCELCLKSFKEQKWMDTHVKKHEPSAGSHVCSICHIRCRTPKLYRTHRDCNHTTRYACRRCPFITYSKAQALKHHSWHEGVEHTCQHCGATFRKHTTYMGHLRRAHPSAHICGYCARSFVSAYGLNLHIKAVHKDINKLENDSMRCEECDVTFVSRQMYIRHVLISDRHKDMSKDILGCRKCGEQFESKEEMEKHTHYKERKYVRKDAPRRIIKCDECSEVFSHPNGVYQHYLREHPDTPYRFAVRRHYLCEQCGKTFKSPGLLQQHGLIHLGLRPPAAKKPPGRNSCRLCGKTYSKLSGLFRHKLTHLGVRRHKCHICDKAFTDTSNLKQHVQGVHLNIRRVRKR